MTSVAQATPSRLATQWNDLVRIHAQVEHALATALNRAHRLGLSEYRALEALIIAPDHELRVQDLAEHLALNQSSVSRLVGRLEAADLTVRDICADDRRGVYCVLTNAGRERYQEALVTYEATLARSLRDAGISLDALVPRRPD